ncbi:MAG: hypothetical protein ACI4O7_02575 [Aristaeellaceae bacterium]
MPRRLLTFLLCLTLLVPAPRCLAGEPSVASEAYLAEVGVISQRDPALDQACYIYRGCRFWERGCLPASVANAIIAAFGVEGMDNAALLLEVMLQATPGHRPDQHAVDLASVARLLCGDPPDDCPALQQLIGSMAAIEHARHRSGPELAQQLAGLGDSRVALIFNLNIRSDWQRVLEITDALCDAGLPQARLTLCNLTVGVPGTSAPFHSSGRGGHFAALYFEAGEFHDTGTFYLLDSYPRALEGDSYAPGDALYLEPYPFVSSRQFQTFNSLYRVTHVTPTVVRLSLQPDALQTLACPPEDRAALRLKQLQPVVFYGTNASAFLVLP